MFGDLLGRLKARKVARAKVVDQRLPIDIKTAEARDYVGPAADASKSVLEEWVEYFKGLHARAHTLSFFPDVLYQISFDSVPKELWPFLQPKEGLAKIDSEKNAILEPLYEARQRSQDIDRFIDFLLFALLALLMWSAIVGFALHDWSRFLGEFLFVGGSFAVLVLVGYLIRKIQPLSKYWLVISIASIAGAKSFCALTWGGSDHLANCLGYSFVVLILLAASIGRVARSSLARLGGFLTLLFILTIGVHRQAIPPTKMFSLVALAILAEFAMRLYDVWTKRRSGRRAAGLVLIALGALNVKAMRDVGGKLNDDSWAAIATLVVATLVGIFIAFYAEQTRRRFWLTHGEHILESLINLHTTTELTVKEADQKAHIKVLEGTIGIAGDQLS